MKKQRQTARPGDVKYNGKTWNADVVFWILVDIGQNVPTVLDQEQEHHLIGFLKKKSLEEFLKSWP